MVKVRRANAILEVAEEDVDRYYGMGYDILDENENVAKNTIPSDLTVLKAAYGEHIKKIDLLENLLAQACGKTIEEVRQIVDSGAEVEVEVESEDATEDTEAKTSSKKSRK
jgi:hypothetical protein